MTEGNCRAEGRRRHAMSCSMLQHRRVRSHYEAGSCHLDSGQFWLLHLPWRRNCRWRGRRRGSRPCCKPTIGLRSMWEVISAMPGDARTGARPLISPARSACSSPPIFSTGRAATSGGCKSATTTCCRTASCSVPSSTPRFRAFQISTASPSAASRSSPRRRAAWRAIARRCFTPAPCAVASVTLPATGCSMRPAASPGPTTSWR